MRPVFLLFILLAAARTFAQNEFDKYGPYGCETFTDLKLALNSGAKIYKMDLSHQKVDPKLYAKISKLSDLQALKLSGNGVTDYPENFGSLFNLVYFASYNNKFTSFPPDLKNFRNMYYLELQHTAIDSVPAGIAFLNRLQSFKFGNTDDTLRLPNSLPFLKNLKDLSFENCILDSMPKQLFKNPGLYFLSLNNTNTWYLSKHFERLPNLEVLIVENNHLNALPFDIYKASKLRLISLRGNNLKKLPASISQLENLSLLDLRGNPIEPEELEIIKALLPGCQVKF